MKRSFHGVSARSTCRRNLRLFRLTIIFILFSVLKVEAWAGAQTVTISVTDMPLEKVCKEVEKQTGYYFVYAKDMNKTTYKITVDIRSAHIEEALRKIFDGLPFSYQVIEKVIVVNTVRKSVETKMMSSSNDDPSIKVDGVVISDQGQPLSGASVTVKASGKVTLTNLKGEFSFASIPENSILIITYVGYSTQQVIGKASEKIIVKLAVATDVLDGMVIKGYYNTTNRLNTGSVSVVKGEDIAKQPVTDPILALEGRVPGLYIQQTSGVPGSNSTIHLRGVNSMPSDGKLVTLNDPLFIVDGVPFSSQSLTNSIIGGGMAGSPSAASASGYVDFNSGQGLSPFNNLNPADIESVTVLKDADATAIYGSRGGNGVIVITTKRGKAGPTKVDVNVFTGIGKITRTLDLLNTQQYLQMRREAFRNDGKRPGATDFDINGFWDTTRYTNWQKVLINNPAPLTNAQLNLSGGNPNTQFYLSGSYGRQGTSMPGDYADKKVSFHINLCNVSSNQKFRLQLSAGYTNDDNDLPADNLVQYITLAPDAPAIYDAYGALNWQIYDGSASWTNPLSYINANMRSVSEFLNSNLVLNYEPFQGMEIKCSMGYNHGQMNQKALFPGSYQAPPYNTDPNSRLSYFASADNKTWIAEPQASYHLHISKGKLDLLWGATFQRSYSKNQGLYGVGYASDALIENPLLASSSGLTNYSSSAYYYAASYGQLGYTWEDKYLLNFTARRDGSSRFGPGRQFGNFGAIGIGWIFSKENFFKQNLSALSFGKIRVSYGTSGNDNIANYQFMSTYSISSSLKYQGNPILTPSRIPNPYYSWETVKKLEAALELGFIRDRVLLSISYYRNRSGNQLIGYPLPLLTGFSNVQANSDALVQNTGLEFVLNTTNLREKDWTWTSSFNMTLPNNKLISYPNLSSSPYRYYFQSGKSLFSRNVYHYTGISQQTGLYQFSSLLKNGTPNYSTDRVFTRPITQTYFGGLQNGIHYKRFQLDVFIQFVKQLNLNYLSNFSGKTAGIFSVNLPEFFGGHFWQKTGDNALLQKLTTIPSSPSFANFLDSDGNISNASFIRLKNLAFSYELPTAAIKRARLQSMRLYLQCQNLLTFTHFKGLDPETSGLLPPIRMITGGCQIVF